VTPEAAAVLSDLRKRGVLDVHEHSEVLDASWDWEQERWDVWLQVSMCCAGTVLGTHHTMG
jgi:hypothetical protein